MYKKGDGVFVDFSLANDNALFNHFILERNGKEKAVVSRADNERGLIWIVGCDIAIKVEYVFMLKKQLEKVKCSGCGGLYAVEDKSKFSCPDCSPKKVEALDDLLSASVTQQTLITELDEEHTEKIVITDFLTADEITELKKMIDSSRVLHVPFALCHLRAVLNKTEHKILCVAS